VRHPLVQKIVVAYELRDEKIREDREREQAAREARRQEKPRSGGSEGDP
jgi:hypothetical protein